jgi:hypothetical protein
MTTKTKPKHTPGPWTVSANENDDPILDLDGNSPLDFEAVGFEYAANLRLIAAAPEMLEALELVLKMHDAMRIEQDKMPRSFEAPLTVDAVGVLVEHAKAAIRKAKGETV